MTTDEHAKRVKGNVEEFVQGLITSELVRIQFSGFSLNEKIMAMRYKVGEPIESMMATQFYSVSGMCACTRAPFESHLNLSRDLGVHFRACWWIGHLEDLRATGWDESSTMDRAWDTGSSADNELKTRPKHKCPHEPPEMPKTAPKCPHEPPEMPPKTYQN